MPIGDEDKGMKAAEAETTLKLGILQEYAGWSEDAMQVELDAVERQMPDSPRSAHGLEMREKVLRGALEGGIWQSYVDMDLAQLKEEMEELQAASGRAEAEGVEGEVKVRHLDRVAKVLAEMIESWG
jgi:hypothetical protein